MIQLLKNRWFYHPAIWLVIAVPELMTAINSEKIPSPTVGILMVLSYLVPTMLAVYGNFYLIVRLFEKRRFVLYFLSLPAIVALYALWVTWSEQQLGSHDRQLMQEVVNIVLFLLMATGVRYLKRGLEQQFKMQELEAKTAQQELAALKGQLNPHFLFNTLNNIYAVNQMDAAKGSEMILELSEVLVYHIGHTQKDTLSVEEEMQLINAYITLEKLRLNDNCEVITDLSPQNNRLLIAPLLLMPFIENAFKHGTHPSKPCFVHIHLTTKDRLLLFTIKNSVVNNKHVVKTHIGLENTRRRLALLYPQTHQLQIQQTDSVYQVQLSITT